jgi:mRNA interferase RelE/StbE
VYRIEFTGAASKQFLKLPVDIRGRVAALIDDLAETPMPPGSLTLTAHIGWRVRVGGYRIIYVMDRARQLITIDSVAHRSEAYRFR